jgi:hypothetical protein
MGLDGSSLFQNALQHNREGLVVGGVTVCFDDVGDEQLRRLMGFGQKFRKMSLAVHPLTSPMTRFCRVLNLRRPILSQPWRLAKKRQQPPS